MTMFARWAELIIGITLMALGVAFTLGANLGTTPNSALAAALAPITGLSVGIITLLANVVYMVMQIALLRNRYRWIQLFQFLPGTIFGVLIDAWMFLIDPYAPENNYFIRLIWGIIGIICMGVGIGLQVHANLINMPGEGMVLALTAETRRIAKAHDEKEKTSINFGNVKIFSDLTHVVIAVILGLVFLDRLEGVREATIAAAFLLGIISRMVINRLPPNTPIVKPKPQN